MNTYSLLLVDDEEEVTQVIERKIDWAKLGFCVIGHANNGLKALEMIEEFQPDVVMTDIRMPYMDGGSFVAKSKADIRQQKFCYLPALMNLNMQKKPFTWRSKNIS